jgi:hypothetical protein
MQHSIDKYVCFIILQLILYSCLDTDLYEGDSLPGGELMLYHYPYGNEARNVIAEITLLTSTTPEMNQIEMEIPMLKYNKSWLFMLTQDDNSHTSYCVTWAAINNKPLSRSYFYSSEQLAAGDLPPDYITFNKALGSSDGAGKEIRFAFTTTLLPETNVMEEKPIVRAGLKKNFYRFSKMNGLSWNNLMEMLPYDTGIAFHNLDTKSRDNIDSLRKHLEIAQQITLSKLSGRGLKSLAEPDGNHNYLLAGLDYNPIRVMTAQGTHSSGPTVEKFYPFKIELNRTKLILQRTFYNSTFDITSHIEKELRKQKEEREAIHVGIHSADLTFAQFLLWLNDNYGKDGDDSVWFPSMEEYYEYYYYRANSKIDHEVNGNTLKLRITLPTEQYFYYPSLTINLKGITYNQISQVLSNDAVTGLSYAPYEGGVMLNIDCRRFLVELAAHYVDKYQRYNTVSNKSDAIYFIKKLKDSPEKDALANKIPGYIK